ncbi:tRNA-dihydrouridine synthase [uncultured Arsenicicoccus sp.]|uniref:tRNA-dihydrouridine synthase n=1 Tax=uncultured Arsenicicoccus sp. TaxID=491339 RepID=UPI0025980677|nr:tRNA-dihydrouridine synthase [uncultured Arsenicicoccus sp.]
MTTRRSQVVVLGMTAVLASTLTGCSQETRRTSAGVCVDAQTNERLPDSECDGRRTRAGFVGNPARWYYYNDGARVPGVGQRVSGGSFSAPSNHSYVTGGVDPKGTSTLSSASVKGGKGTTISRGGFGGSGGKGSS